jgi:hypothetical protein
MIAIAPPLWKRRGEPHELKLSTDVQQLQLFNLHTFSGTWPAPLRWWAALCVVTALNLGAWTWAAWAFRRRSRTTESPTNDLRRWQPGLSAVFVLVCGFRAVFPRADVQRICLHDSWLSSVAVGRSLATIAELCFIAQWAFLLRELGTSTRNRFAVTISWLLIPLICVAESCSWYAVLTTRYVGNAFEESIWALSAILAIAGAAAAWPRIATQHRPQLALAIVFGVAYVAFMCGVDVPMYVSRWLADESHGRHYLSLGQGVRDVSLRWVVTDSWEDWRSEMPWMSLYFSVAVWISIALMHAPRFAHAGVPDRPAPAGPPAFSRGRGPSTAARAR